MSSKSKFTGSCFIVSHCGEYKFAGSRFIVSYCGEYRGNMSFMNLFGLFSGDSRTGQGKEDFGI